MGLDDLQPGNTKRARATAVKVFAKFLKVENVELEYVCDCITSDASGRMFVSVMDKFGMYLAFNEGKAGKQLARHTCMQYYRQAKHWLLDQFPQHRVALEAKLLKMDRTLESFCLKREGGGFVKKAAACTKHDLKRMIIYFYVNRLLNRIARAAGVEEQLTPHSFRRGEAQHANASVELADRWIFDRGAWNVSSTNKAFNYVFNTRAEDHKVAKVLSGWRPHEAVPLADLKIFDAQTLEQIVTVQQRLFSTCWKMSSPRFCVSTRALDVLMAYVLLHYPQLKKEHPQSPVVLRLEACALEAQSSIADLLAWSSHIASARSAPVQTTTHQDDGEHQKTEEQKVICYQATVIDHLMDHSKRQERRLDALEAIVSTGTHEQRKRATAERGVDSVPVKRRQCPPVADLRTTWYDWYCREPRLWDTQDNKQRKSDAKLVAAYMKLFLGAFALREGDATYRDVVMAMGETAEQNVVAFLKQRKISAKGSQSVLKQIRALHKADALNESIVAHKRLIVAGAIIDPAPAHTQDVLEPVAVVTDK